MPDLTHKSVGAIVDAPVPATVDVPQPALAEGDVAVLVMYDNGRTTPVVVENYEPFASIPDGAAGAHHLYWRRAAGTIAATNVSVTWTGQGYAKILVASGSVAGIGAPTVATDSGNAVNVLTGAYWESLPLTVTDRLVYHQAWIFDARKQGSVSNRGKISSKNTSRAYEALPGAGMRVHTVSSVITSSAGGRVRGAFGGGNAQSVTLSVIMPNNPAPAPTDVTATGGDHAITGGFEADPNATQFRGQWRRTDLVRPSTTTQAGAPAHLRRISQENLPLPSDYTYDFTGDGVPYAQFDSGCRVTHNEFGGRYVTGGSIAGPWNTDNAPNPPFSQGHGTGVAAMALGTTYGVAKDAILYSVNSGDEAGPTMEQYEDSAAWLIANKPANRTVALNISNGFPLDDIPRLEAFFDSLYLNGIAVFVAAGNTNDELPYNAFQYRFFVVGASTQADVKASYSDYGDGIDLYAPMSPTTTAGNQSNTATRIGDGTSEASPMAAGVALKILEGNPELAPWRLYEVLRSQAFVGKISGIPTGPNRLLNGNANTDEWSDFPVDGDTFTLDGLDADATYEVRFAQMVDGEWSDWSDSATATTTGTPVEVTGTLDADLPAIAVDVPTAAFSASVTVPTFEGTLEADLPAVDVAAPELTASATVTAPEFTGSLEADLPDVTVDVPTFAATASTGTPAFEGTLEADLPAIDVDVPTLAASASTTVPAFTGSLEASLPDVTVDVPQLDATGTTTSPAYSATLAADLPGLDVLVPTAAFTASYTPPGATGGTLEADLPPLSIDVPTLTVSATSTLPDYDGTLEADLPGVTIDVPQLQASASTTVPAFTAALEADLPTLDVRVEAAWTAAVTEPESGAVLAASLPAITIDVPTFEASATVLAPVVGSLAADLPTITVGPLTIHTSSGQAPVLPARLILTPAARRVLVAAGLPYAPQGGLMEYAEFTVKEGDTYCEFTPNLESIDGWSFTARRRPYGTDEAGQPLDVAVIDAERRVLGLQTATLAPGEYDFEVHGSHDATGATFPASGWHRLVVWPRL